MKYIEKTVFEVNYGDLDKAISEEFGIEFEIVAHHELMNDVAWTCTVRPEPMEEYYRGRLEGGNFIWMGGILLNEMCHRGKIPAGKYVVEISW